jgi:CrcB protein
VDLHPLGPRLFLLVGAGGLAGTFTRYGIQLLLQSQPHAFPRGTLLVNIIGCFIFGFFVRYFAAGDLDVVRMRIAITVGFCGAFTTMSSFSYESLVLVETGRFWEAATYFVGSIGGSMVAVAAGVLAAQHWAGPALGG